MRARSLNNIACVETIELATEDKQNQVMKAKFKLGYTGMYYEVFIDDDYAQTEGNIQHKLQMPLNTLQVSPSHESVPSYSDIVRKYSQKDVRHSQIFRFKL